MHRRGDRRTRSNCTGSRAGCDVFVFRTCAKGGSTSPKAMVNESPKAQISGGKAASFANALRTTRFTSAVATDRPWRKMRFSILLPKIRK